MKTQNEFLECLEEELRFLKAQEIQEILKHYRERIATEIDYGAPEEKVIKNLPDPKDIAKEIYDARGISFLEIQKRKYRRAEIIKAIISSFVVALMLVLFASVSIYIGYVLLGVNKILLSLPALTSRLDCALLVGIVLCIDLCGLLVYIFIIDLFYILITHFLVNILKACKKTYRVHYKFQDFTISGTLKKLCKNNNVVGISLGAFATLALVIGIASYITKGYMYKSFSDINTKSYEEIITNDISKIYISGTNANVDILLDKETNDIKVTYMYEMEYNAKISYEDNVLSISNISSNKYGLFGLLDEPTPKVVISIPTVEYLSYINIKLDESIIYMRDIQNSGLIVDIDVYANEIYLQNPDLKSLNVEDCYKTKTVIAKVEDENNKDFQAYITFFDIKANTGSIIIDNVNFNKLIIDSLATSTVVKNTNAKEFTLVSGGGSVVLYDVYGETLNFTTSSSNNILDDINYRKATFLSRRAATITINRLMSYNEVILEAESNGNILITNLKAKTTNIKQNYGSIKLSYINKNVSIKSDDSLTSEEKHLQENKIDYNNFMLQSTLLKGTSNGYINIEMSDLENVELTQNGSSIDVNNTVIKNKAVFNMNSVNSVTYTNVTGTDIHFVVDHDIKNTNANFVYNNDVAGQKIYIKYISASLRPQGNVIVEPEPEAESKE